MPIPTHRPTIDTPRALALARDAGYTARSARDAFRVGAITRAELNHINACELRLAGKD